VYKIYFIFILTYLDIDFKDQEHLTMAGSSRNMLLSDTVKYTEQLRVDGNIKYIFYIKELVEFMNFSSEVIPLRATLMP
jgi:hypothetical protein